jgi:hypothetical protein
MRNAVVAHGFSEYPGANLIVRRPFALGNLAEVHFAAIDALRDRSMETQSQMNAASEYKTLSPLWHPKRARCSRQQRLARAAEPPDPESSPSHRKGYQAQQGE